MTTTAKLGWWAALGAKADAAAATSAKFAGQVGAGLRGFGSAVRASWPGRAVSGLLTRAIGVLRWGLGGVLGVVRALGTWSVLTMALTTEIGQAALFFAARTAARLVGWTTRTAVRLLCGWTEIVPKLVDEAGATVREAAVIPHRGVLDLFGKPGRWVASKIDGAYTWAVEKIKAVRTSPQVARVAEFVSPARPGVQMVRSVATGLVARAAIVAFTPALAWLAWPVALLVGIAATPLTRDFVIGGLWAVGVETEAGAEKVNAGVPAPAAA